MLANSFRDLYPNINNGKTDDEILAYYNSGFVSEYGMSAENYCETVVSDMLEDFIKYARCYKVQVTGNQMREMHWCRECQDEACWSVWNYSLAANGVVTVADKPVEKCPCECGCFDEDEDSYVTFEYIGGGNLTIVEVSVSYGVSIIFNFIKYIKS
jgi:hypothetical protein